MPQLRSTLSFVAVANLMVVLAGCAGNVANLATVQGKSTLPTIMANGREFVLGFNDNRYAQVANKVPVKVLPHLGLLPPSVDNRSTCSPIANQGKLGSCTAFASTKGFREFMINKLGERQVPLAALFTYYESRWDKQSDTGSTNTDSVGVLEETGVAPESAWPYDIAKFALKPPTEAYAAAKEFKFNKFVHLASRDLEGTKTALAAGVPVIFAFDVYESFRKIGKDGVMPVPAPGEKRLGGHAVLAVGYSDETKMVTVRNSWGGDWGDGGYFYMPYSVYSGGARDLWTTETKNN